MATSSKVSSHSHADLEKQIAELQRDLAALSKKCASLEGKLSSSPAGGDDLVKKSEFAAFRRKVAKRLGFRL